jgi:hypothetical protein
MRRLPYELYGVSALMAMAIALVVRAWRREETSVAGAVSRWWGAVRHRAA